jgi:fermentation-respiration switch protein FrsA (DUF1100 family)
MFGSVSSLGASIGKNLIGTGLIVAAVWLIVCVALIVYARPLIYQFQPGFSAAVPTSLPGARAETLSAADGTPLIVWVKSPAPDRPVVLFFMGNGGVLAGHAPLLDRLAAEGFGIAALNYRGAGGAPGEPSQPALTADAAALYEGLDRLLGATVPRERRVIWGASLGAALAVQLAARRDAAALVLESPFNRLCEVAQFHYPIFPVCLLLPYERWDSAAAIAGLDRPTLILHGEADRIIPLAQGRKLFEVVIGPKRLITYPARGHNDLDAAAIARDATAFLGEVLYH